MKVEQTPSPSPEEDKKPVTEGSAADAAAPEDTANPDANPEGSSASDADAKEPSLLDVVKAAVEPAPVEDSSTPKEETDAEPKAEDDPAKEEPKAEETEAERDAKLPFHEHPRWKEVIAERDALREPAKQFGVINDFMDANGLTAENIAEGFTIMADLKSNDPARLAEARKWFNSNLQRLDGMLGETLPDDLRERVESGYIDEETAKETARLRATSALQAETAERTRKASEEAQRAQQARQQGETLARAVETWEAQAKATDPDFSKKEAMVEAQCHAIVARTGKRPTTPDEAVALAKQAYEDVNAQFASLVPAKRPVSADPRPSSVTPIKEPKSLFDAVNNALATSA